jgi:hypothetical protein
LVHPEPACRQAGDTAFFAVESKGPSTQQTASTASPARRAVWRDFVADFIFAFIFSFPNLVFWCPPAALFGGPWWLILHLLFSCPPKVGH